MARRRHRELAEARRALALSLSDLTAARDQGEDPAKPGAAVVKAARALCPLILTASDYAALDAVHERRKAARAKAPPRPEQLPIPGVPVRRPRARHEAPPVVEPARVEGPIERDAKPCEVCGAAVIAATLPDGKAGAVDGRRFPWPASFRGTDGGPRFSLSMRKGGAVLVPNDDREPGQTWRVHDCPGVELAAAVRDVAEQLDEGARDGLCTSCHAKPGREKWGGLCGSCADREEAAERKARERKRRPVLPRAP
jgi:hypothetical protein